MEEIRPTEAQARRLPRQRQRRRREARVVAFSTPLGTRVQAYEIAEGGDLVLFESDSADKVEGWLVDAGYVKEAGAGVWHKKPARRRAPSPRQAAAFVLHWAANQAASFSAQELTELLGVRVSERRAARVRAAAGDLLKDVEHWRRAGARCSR